MNKLYKILIILFPPTPLLSFLPQQIPQPHRLPLSLHSLPLHKRARNGKQGRTRRAPSDQHAKIEADLTMRAEQDGATALDDIVQGPGVAPVEEAGAELDLVEAGADVCDDPEDEPEAGPGLADEHGDVFGGEAEGDHAEEVEHPVDGEGAEVVEVGVGGDEGVGGGRVREGDLESQRDEGVGE